MKFIKYITPALFCAALTLQSCEHFLDTKPMESYSEDLVWSLKSTADAFVLQTYNNVLPFLPRYPYRRAMDSKLGHAAKLPE